MIEVLIAALIATAVISGLTLAIASSGQLIGKAEVSTQMARASSSVFERLEANDGWVGSCGIPTGATESTCTLYDNPGGADGVNGSGPVNLDDIADDDKLRATWKLRVTGTAVDDPADGLRSDPRGDRDGRVPDRVTVLVTLEVPAVAKARLGNPPTYEQSRTFDGRGRIASGSLIVEVCDVENQIDDRMNIETCGTSSSNTRMADCPPGKCRVFSSVVNQPASKDSPNGSVMVRRWTPVLPIRITSGSETVNGTSLGDGSYVFKNVAAGSWSIQYPASLPNGHVVWAGHVRPAAGQVAVQPNTTSRGLITYRPSRTGKIEAQFTRRVGMIEWANDIVVQDLGGDLPDFEGDLVWRTSPWPGCGYPGRPGPDVCNNPDFRYWSEYMVDNRAEMYIIKPTVRWEVWGGASDEISLSTRPEAYGRAVNLSVEPPVEYLVSKTVLPRRGYNVEHIETLEGMQAGLYSPVRVSSDSDQDLIRDARNVVGGPVWINPDTGQTNGGTPQFEVRGQGECYVGYEGVRFQDGKSSYSDSMDDMQLIRQARNAEFVDVDGFDGWRDDGCSMRLLKWNGERYDCIVVCAYRFCWQKRTKYRGASSSRDPITGEWDADSYYEGQWYEKEDCWGYEPPLACRDRLATRCGPAVIYIPPVPQPCDGCGSTPAVATRFTGVTLGS